MLSMTTIKNLVKKSNPVVQIKSGTGNHIQRKVLATMTMAKTNEVNLNHLHSFQARSPLLSERVTGIVLRIDRNAKRKPLM